MILSAKKKKTNSLTGVDIDADSIAAAGLPAGEGPLRALVEPLPSGVFSGGEIVDVDAVALALEGLFDRGKLAKQVRLAVASQGVVFRTLRLPLIENPEQLRSAVRFQAQEQIPMPLESAVLDHQVIAAHVAEDGSRHIDVAVVAARRNSIDQLLAVARKAGLDPVGIDLAAFGMIRALAAVKPSPDAGSGAVTGSDAQPYVPAVLYCSLAGITNLAIAQDFSCLFSRVAQFGVRDLANELAGTIGLPLEHAEQWLVHTGLETPLDQVEGDPAAAVAARTTLEAGVTRLADELRLSLDYYGAQEGAAQVDDIVLCGWGSAIPGLAGSLGAILGRGVSVGRPGALTAYSDVEAARLTLPYGLSLEH
jgi:type IV pilus assembly protein PilM